MENSFLDYENKTHPYLFEKNFLSDTLSIVLIESLITTQCLRSGPPAIDTFPGLLENVKLLRASVSDDLAVVKP